MIVIGLFLMAGLALLARSLLDDDGRASSAGNDGAAAAYGEARAARIELSRLKARVDDLELRLKIAEARTGYTALDGTRLPPVSDPLATTTPPGNSSGGGGSLRGPTRGRSPDASAMTDRSQGVASFDCRLGCIAITL